MTQEYKTAISAVIYLASCAVRDIIPNRKKLEVKLRPEGRSNAEEEPQGNQTENCSGTMDLTLVYQAAEQHLLTAAVAYALESAGIHDHAFTEAKAKAIRKVALMDAEMSVIFAKMTAAGIWYMPLKGTVIKDDYPKYGMRQMADHDILFDADRAGDVRDIMESCGFTTEHFGEGNHDVYFKPPVLNFEMHTALFGKTHENSMYEYYSHMEDRLLGEGCAKHFSPEDFYIYLIAHEYKHYSGGGTGLRSLLDTYVYLHKHELDMAYVEQELEKMHIREFETEQRSLSFHLFGGEKLTEEDRRMLHYILSSGTYGTIENKVKNQLHKKGRWGYFRSRMTLPYDMMQDKFPVLKKAPLLYPFCWAYRLIHGFIFKHDRFMYQLKAVIGFRCK